MQPSRPIVSDHRLARLIAWLGAVLAWCALGRPTRTRAQARRHKRYSALGIADLAHFVRNVVILRAVQLLDPQIAPARRRTSRPAHIPTGCKLGKERRLTLRRFGGVWLRRMLMSRGSFAAKVAHLIQALRHYSGLAAYVAWRRRRFTRRCAIIPARPRVARVVSRAAPAPHLVDTS
ncbi:MAG TPA: hypothetical protein VEA80_06930 [Vitreimonas sp.]|uniref:hypothetical protein n=1 Tax=Vitreimonas sp. TaxID=3069702 RepID=UPI002D6B12D7|nr:hypothetical protein [Vitreimonas sp.]HYD87189.1 hypothetical protein [Vitreimonas sp.]